VFKCEVLERLKRLESKLDAALAALVELSQGEAIMSAELDALTAQVKQNTDLEASAVTLIQGLAAQIQAARDDPAKLDALTAELRQKADALADAITTNTPPAP
jgi:chromosome segregation ATPase